MLNQDLRFIIEKNNKKTLSLFQACQTQASYNSDPGHRYKLRVIQVNRLSQVLAHRDKFRGYRTATSAIVSKIVNCLQIACLQTICRHFVGNLHSICSQFATNLQKICRQYEGNMQATYRQFVGNLQAIRRQFAGNLQAIYRPFAGNLL